MIPTVCAWTQDCDGCWTSGCGHAFEFNDGTPRENGVRFCMFCGYGLRQRSYRDPGHRARLPQPVPLTSCDMK